MPKKEDKNADKSDINELLKSVVSSAALAYVKTYAENLSQRIHSYAYNLEKKIFHLFFASFTMMLGIFVLFISFPFLMNQYLGLTIGWSLFIVGMVLIIIAGIIQMLVKKEKIKF